MTRSTGRITGLAIVTLIAFATATAPALRGAWADDAPAPKPHHHKVKKTVTTTTTTTTTAASDQQKKIDALSKQLEDMQKQQADLMAQIKDMKTQMAVAAPAVPSNAPSPATAPGPATIGEHVAVVESDLAQTKKDLATNLGVSIHGLVDASYEHNFNQPVGETNVYRAWDNDGFQLTQGNLHIEKDGTVGFVTDINVGQVAEAINGVSHFSGAPADAGTGRWIDPTQYYLTYTMPIGSGISLQAGRFVTLLGEEVIPTYTNQNYNETRGLVFNLGEPLTHTGIRASYTFNEYVAFTGGLNNGWDDPGNINNGGPNYEGEITINNKDKSLALVLNGIYGPDQIGHSNSYRGAIDPIVTWKPAFVPNLTLAGEYLYASETGHVVNGHSSTWQGFAQYIVYDWNAWESATRGEFFNDEDGSRTGVHQTLWEITQTLTYKVPDLSGLLVRGEYRHDNSNHHVFTNNNFVDPTTGLQHEWKGQDTILGSLIYAF
ncbi:MAG TPA: outer membrane beta-barrel protein [Candidatus Binataceae bacterium]|nr:outer membrane beta-barrel protein [Candidatus Binataceae bacterium]